MAALAKVGDYLREARVLLQDTVTPYRYSDDDLASALSIGLLEVRRLRADLFYPYQTDIPSFLGTDQALQVPMDIQYRSSLLYYMIGKIELRDGEPEKDQRAGALLQKAIGQFLTITS